MDSCFSPRGSTWSHTICLRGRGYKQIKLLRISITYSLCKVNVRLFTATVKHNNQFVVGTNFSFQVCLLCSRAALKNTFWVKFLSKLQKDNIRAFKNVVIWCYFVSALCAFVLTQCIEKDIPSGCCLIGSLPVTWLIWRSLNAVCTYDQSRSEHPHMTKWLECQSGPQTGLSFSRQEAGSSRGAALSHLPAALAASLPHHWERVWWCAQVHAGRLIWFHPLWHICCLSCCVVPVCEPSTTGANVPLMLPFMFTNRPLAYKLAGMVCNVWKVRRPEEMRRASVRLVLRAITSHSLLPKCRLYHVRALH